MPIWPGNSWTVGFFRAHLSTMTLPSAWRYRSFILRDAAGNSIEQLIRLKLRPPFGGNIWIREIGSDTCTYDEIFVRKVYSPIADFCNDCEYIIDLGANIGLATRYFAGIYPASRIFAVEPDPSNYALFTKNTTSLKTEGRLQSWRGAVWHSEAVLSLESPNNACFDAFTVQEIAGEAPNVVVSALPMEEIIARARFPRIDLLKIDIEGAESILFSGQNSWLAKIRTIAIEFHGDSRNQSGFDEIIRGAGFEIHDCNNHTIIAHRSDSSRSKVRHMQNGKYNAWAPLK